jgi:TonB-dependent receptor
MAREHIIRRVGLFAGTSMLAISGTAAAQTTVPGEPTSTGASAPGAPPTQTTPPSDASASPGASGDAVPGAAAQPADIVVTGIRASQQRAIALKRNAASITDSISAEDIGKLPDVTITDSLQRIPGVQIRRAAGEGASINIRGLPQVTTLLNGESYLSGNSITTVQPNLQDIPSQLFAGADVIKSSTADLLDAGITGTVNLRTRRPFDFIKPFTISAAAEAQHGDITDRWDPNVNGLVAWHGDRIGVLVSAAYTNVYLANSQEGMIAGYGGTIRTEGKDALGTSGFSPPTRPRGTRTATGADVNGDGDQNDAYFVPQGFEGYNTVNRRQRLGINGSVQWKVTDNLEITGDGFYARQDERARIAGYQQADINWQAAEFVPAQTRNTGAKVNGGYDFNTVGVYNYDLGDFSLYSQNDHSVTTSQNYNLEAKFDNHNGLRITARGLYGKARQSYDQSYAVFSPSNGLQWEPGGIGRYPASIGGNRPFNPNGYTVDTLAGLSSLQSVVNFSGDHPVLSLPSQLTTLLGDTNSLGFKGTSSESNYREEADLKVFRLDGSYRANDSVELEFGARYSDRDSDNYVFDRAAPLYAGQAQGAGATADHACLVKWKAFDVPLNSNAATNPAACSVPDGTGAFYTSGVAYRANDPRLAGIVKQVSTPTAGVPPIYVIDPKAMDNALAFQNSLYPGNVEVENPGASYTVGVRQVSGYGQVNLSGQLLGIPVHANAGVKVINTRLDVIQNITGVPRPYGLSNYLQGTTETRRSFTDLLPSFNVAFDVTDHLRVRTAMTRTMTLLNLSQWGGGLNPTYAIDTSGPSPLFRVTGGSSSGNPLLDPWRATNWDLSAEYYFGRASLVSVAGFYIDVDSFIQNGAVIRTDLPDNDGVVRGRSVSITTPLQGAAGVLKGVEAQWQQSFQDLTFMPRFLSNFGFNLNLTFSPSKTGQTDLAGNDIPFQDNSRIQTNAVAFYQDRHLQARIAWNYRSKRAASQNFGGVGGLELYQRPTSFVDASVSYDVNPHFTIYAQGSNLTKEYERYYLVWEDEKAYNNLYEQRFILGGRVKF